MWAYLVFHVEPSDDGVDWALVVEKLEATCPSDGDALAAMSHIAASENEPYIVKVSGFDRPGLLWRISRAFWVLDCSVFKSQVSTDAEGHALDSFWVHDNTGRLPGPGRALEISDYLLELLGGNVDVSIRPAPSQTQIVPKNISAVLGSGFSFFEGERLRRLACKDATSHSNLRSLLIKNHVAQKHWSSSDSLRSSCSGSSRSGSQDDLFAGGMEGSIGGTSGGTSGGTIGSDVPGVQRDARMPEKEFELFNNTAGDPNSSTRHRRMSSILMETPEKRVDASLGSRVTSDAGEGLRSLVEPGMLTSQNLELAFGSVSANNSAISSAVTRFGPRVQPASQTSITREFDADGNVSIEADTHTSQEYILLDIKCLDRKGILYDIFVQLKEIRVRVANCRTSKLDDGRVRIELMVQDAYGGDICSAGEENDSASILAARMRDAICRPVTVVLGRNGRGKCEGQYRLMVVAMVDAGGRGRPQVTYDVTKLFSSLGLSITECEVFVEEGHMDEDESFEVHKYVFEQNTKSVRLRDTDMQKLTDAIAMALQGRNREGSDLPTLQYA